MPNKKPKKILIFSLAYYPNFVGGAEIAIKEITDRISPEEIEFHMVTLRFNSRLPKTERKGNVIVHRIGFSMPSPTVADLKRFPLFLNKYWFQFVTAFAASRLHRRYRFDAIWAMMAHSCGIPAGIFKTFHPEVRYVLTLQEGDPPEHIERLARPVWPLFKRGFTKADIVQSISNFLATWARRMGYEGSIGLIPNGVDAEHFSGVPVAHKGTVLITLSRLVHKNAVDDIIRALAFLPPSIRLQILGIGTDESMLKELARKKGVSERVEFLGHIDHKDMPHYLHAADIFVRPSRSEGMGNVFIEAMAAGLPVIATQEGGIADFLFDARRNPDKPTTGWAVDKDSPEQIAMAVKDILAHPEQVARVKATAKNMVLEKYDWDLIARAMRTVFDRVLQSR